MGQARNPSKLTVWCIFPGSGLSCRRAKAGRKGAWLCAGSSSPTNVKAAPGNAHCAPVCRRIRSAGPLARLRSTVSPARLPTVWSWCRAGSDRATCRISGLGCQVAGLKGVESSRKQARSLVAGHCSREFQNVKAAPTWLFDGNLTIAHNVKAAPNVARPLPSCQVPFRPCAACGALPLPRFTPASEQRPIVVLSPLPEYALLASGRHVVEDRAQPRPYRGATSERAPAKQK